jgi:phospholipid/cholesterol/gamma-HCH transport system substrate-binding protein
MEKSRLPMKVGLFVFVGLTLLGVLLIQFSKSTSLFRGTYVLHLHAENVGGIKPRAQVLLAGVQVGTVTDIRLAPDDKSVTMDLMVYKDFPIYSDAFFVIEQSGFLGDQFVAIHPAENRGPVLTNDEDVPCTAPFNLLEVARSAAGFIQRIDATAKKLDTSVSALQEEVLNAHTLSSFGVAMTNMQSLSAQALAAVRDIHTLVATNSPQVGVAVSNLVSFSSELNQLGNSAQGLLATNGENINVATKNLEDMSQTFKHIATEL